MGKLTLYGLGRRRDMRVSDLKALYIMSSYIISASIFVFFVIVGIKIIIYANILLGFMAVLIAWPTARVFFELCERFWKIIFKSSR